MFAYLLNDVFGFGDQITASFSHVEMFVVCHKEQI